MPLAQSGSYSSANIETYNDYGNVTNVYNESESNKLKKLKDILKPLSVTDQEANRPKCLKGTRVDLLQQIRTWAQTTDPPNVFVLTGGAGTGKSTVARTIAEEFKSSKSLGCYIFFERGKTDSISITNTVIKTIAYHLACHISAIRESLLDVIKDDHELSFPSAKILFDRLLNEPLHSISISNISNPVLVILDALDECGSIHDQEELADLLKDNVQKLPSNFRFLVTSRPEEGITSLLLGIRSQSHICQHEKLNHTSEDSKKEVVYYVRHELDKLRRDGRIIVRGNWEWDENIDKLGFAAEGLFIWAATAIKFVNGVRAGRFDRLQKLVNDTRGVGMNLDMLYATVLENCIDWKDDEMKERFSSVFSLILFGKTPLLDKDIDEILCYEEDTTSDVLSGLRSLVVFEPDQPIRIHHTSFYDYLTSARCNANWFIDTSVEKNKIASRCFGLMKGQLRFNICDLETSFKLNRDVPDLEKRVNERIRPGFLYTCRYWASHLRDVPYSDKLLSDLEIFAYNQLLYWLEVLSLTGSLYEYLEPVLESAIGWVKNKEGHIPLKISSFLEDALHHLLEFIQPISESTPHIYMSFLPLKRSESDAARHYSKNMKEPTCIECVGEEVKDTPKCIRQISVGSRVSSISLNRDVLSKSASGACLWSVDSGELRKGPFGGDAEVSSWFFGRIIAVNRDGVVDGWNVYTGERIHGLPTIDIGRVTSIANDNWEHYVTGFEDGSIQLWDPQEWTTIGEPLRGHSEKVLALSFSKSVNESLASGSEDQSIIVWNVKRQEKRYPPLKGHSGPITSLAFTISGQQNLVSGSLDGTVCLWKVSSGEMLRAFSASEMGGVYSVAYFYGQHILSGSEDGIIRMWDTKYSKVPPKKLVGHTGKVTSLSVDYSDSSIRFASGSSDGTILVWNRERSHAIVDSSSREIAVSPNGEYLVSVSAYGTVSVWSIETGELILVPLEHSREMTSVSFSPDGFHFASSATDGTVRIWNLDGESITCSCKGQRIGAVRFSPDGKRVASGTENTIRVWDSKSGELVLKPFEGSSGYVHSICYSPDGKRIASGTSDKTICIWDALDGTLLLTLQGHLDRVYSVTYSFKGLYILSGSFDGTIRVWDAKDGKPVCDPIETHEYVISVCFSPDDAYFASGSLDKTACVWNTSTGELLFKANVPSRVASVVFLPSSENQYIKFASADEDGSIRIWYVDVDSKGRVWNAANSDGWVIGNDSKLLYWLPSNIRPTLIGGPCIRILNSRLSTTLTLSKYQGSQWTSCFPS